MDEPVPPVNGPQQPIGADLAQVPAAAAFVDPATDAVPVPVPVVGAAPVADPIPVSLGGSKKRRSSKKRRTSKKYGGSKKKGSKKNKKSRKGGVKSIFESRPIGNTGLSHSFVHGIQPTSMMKRQEKMYASPLFWVAVMFFMVLAHISGPNSSQMKSINAVELAARQNVTTVVNMVPYRYRKWEDTVLIEGKSVLTKYKLTKASLTAAVKAYGNASDTEKQEITTETKELLKNSMGSSRGSRSISGSPMRTSSSRSRSRSRSRSGP